MRCVAALTCALGMVLTVEALPRQLQASGKPDKCKDDASFQAWLAVANQACCTKTTAKCTNGLPSDCDEECANIMIPVRSLLLYKIMAKRAPCKNNRSD
jgi:hypothetical protein